MDNVATISGLVLTWLTILTMLGGAVAAWGKYNRRQIEKALAEVQNRLNRSERSTRVLRIYARRLYDVMLKAQIDPPEPPSEFYD